MSNIQKTCNVIEQELVNDFGCENIQNFKTILLERHPHWEESHASDFISGYCVSAFADLCAEYGYKIKT